MKKFIVLMLILTFAVSVGGFAADQSALGDEGLFGGSAPAAQPQSQLVGEKIFDYYTMEYPSAYIQKKGKMSGTLTLRNYLLSKVINGTTIADRMDTPTVGSGLMVNFAVTNNIEVEGGFEFTNKIISDPTHHDTATAATRRKIIKGSWGTNIVLKRWPNGSQITAGYRYSTTDPDTTYLAASRLHIVASKPYFNGRMIGNFGIVFNYLNSWLFEDKANNFYNVQIMYGLDMKLTNKMLVRLGIKDETTQTLFLIVPVTKFSMMFSLNYKPSDDYRFSFFYEKVNDQYYNTNGARLDVKNKTIDPAVAGLFDKTKSIIGINLTFMY